MSDYFERIEAHLLDAVERQAKSTARPRYPLTSRLGGWLSHRPVLAGGGVASVAVAVLVALALSGGGSPPAYAVVVRPDGTIALTLNEIIGMGPANARLEALGVRARLVRSVILCKGKVRPVPFTVVNHRVLAGNAHGDAKERLRSFNSFNQKRLVTERLAASKEALSVIQSMVRPQKTTHGVRMIIHPSAIPHGLMLVLAFKPVNVEKGTHKTHGGAPIGVAGSISLYRAPVPRCLLSA